MFARRIDPKRASSVVAEILLIIVGINVALWFEGIFQDLRDARTERQYLQGLSEDLLTDLSQLDIVIKSNRAKLENVGNALPMLKELADAPPERQAAIIFQPSSYLFFQPSDFTYQSMQESGDFQLLSNAKIKSDILRLVRRYRHIDNLQTNFLNALDTEYIPLIMNGFDLIDETVTDPSMVQDQLFVNFFAYTYQDTDALIDAYVDAQSMASVLLDDIRSQLGGS